MYGNPGQGKAAAYLEQVSTTVPKSAILRFLPLAGNLLGSAFPKPCYDKSEAMFLADRIAVMRDGEIIQVGTPDEIYRKPIDFFVADFFEDYGLNRYVSSDGEYLIRAEDIDIKADTEAEGITSSGEEIFLSGNISSKEFMGSKIIWHVTCGDKMYIVAGKSDIEAFAPGDTVSLVMKEKNFLRI